MLVIGDLQAFVRFAHLKDLRAALPCEVSGSAETIAVALNVPGPSG